MRPHEMPFLFVIGAPRSGTSWLHQMLAQHPQVAAMASEELTVFSRYLSPWATNFEMEARHNAAGKWRQGMPCLLSATELEGHMLDLVDDVYGRLHARKPQATHLLDKHPNYSNHLPLIDRLLPAARFIHLIRDGREVAVSMMSVRQRVGHSPGDVRGAAREWHRCVTNARAHGQVMGGGRYLEVRYEDLRRDTLAELTRICAFAGLDTTGPVLGDIVEAYHISRRQVSHGDAKLNTLRERPGAIWKEGLDRRQRHIFDRMAGDLLRSLGYAEKGWWALGPWDHVLMLPYGLAVKVKRSLRALWTIWSGPVEEHLT